MGVKGQAAAENDDSVVAYSGQLRTDNGLLESLGISTEGTEGKADSFPLDSDPLDSNQIVPVALKLFSRAEQGQRWRQTKREIGDKGDR